MKIFISNSYKYIARSRRAAHGAAEEIPSSFPGWGCKNQGESPDKEEQKRHSL